MSIITGGQSHRKGFEESYYIVVRLEVMFANGTAVEGVCVTRRNPPVDCPGCEQGKSPGGEPVWRNICKVGCGWPRDRVTMMKGIRCL
jgi:hypothetical protein